MIDPRLAEELAALRRQVEKLEAELGARQARPSRFRFRWPLAAGLLVATVAFAQLTTFQPDTPAVASEINANFNQLRIWLEQKVGAVGSANVSTTGTVSAASVNAASVSATTLTAGTMTATSIAPTTIVSGSVRGGGTSRCNANSSSQLGCVRWGSAECPTGSACGGITCSRGTRQSISSAYCYDASQTAYCYDFLCVE